MAPCSPCADLQSAVSIEKPQQYLELARRLMSLVEDGVLVVTGSSCTLQDLFNAEWPSNTAEHNFECVACGRTFQLFADTYNGHAGWDLTGPPTRNIEPDPAAPPRITVVSESWN